MYTLLYLKWITNKDLLYSTANSAQCYVAAWMGGEFGGEWIHAYVWLSPFVVYLNYHNIVNWLYSSIKYKVKKKKKKNVNYVRDQVGFISGIQSWFNVLTSINAIISTG